MNNKGYKMSKKKNLVFISEKTKALKELAPTTNEIVSVDDKNSNELSLKKNLYSLKEFAEKENITTQRASQLLNDLKVPFKLKDNFDKNGKKIKPIKLIDYNDYLVFKQRQQEEVSIHKNQQSASKINEKYSNDAVMLATGNILNQDIQKQIEVFLSLGNNISNKFKEQENQIKSQEERIKELEEQLVLFEVTKEQLEKSQSTIENLENTIKLVIEGKRKDFTVREIRTTIINSIKYRCWKEHLEHREFTNKVYATFFSRHNFSYEFKQQFYATKPHISFIEDKDLLIEILEITKE